MKLSTARLILAAGIALLVAPRVLGTAQDATPQYTNRLVKEQSPYLQLHAHNPVDWYPWGAEAFERAKREGKPIFLSIGYSTCHWCHVMAAESFADPAIGELMNKTVVAVKVDREERPDIDRVYMAYVVAATGDGAWPMSVFLTPDLKPFFGGTYFPATEQDGRPSFRAVLNRVTRQWATDRDKVLRAANEGRQIIEAHATPPSPKNIDSRALEQTYRALARSYDNLHGGFGTGPKFPRPAALTYLLRYYARTSEKPALNMVVRTLDQMTDGGIHDQLGGGFHRYAVDRAWQVPHFEKMLYDQAQLAIVFTDAFQVTRDAAYAESAQTILDYVLRDLRDADGGFVSAEDADSVTAGGRRSEGAFYVWTAAELRDVLGEDLAQVFSLRYNVADSGNVPRATQSGNAELNGQNILSVHRTIADTAARCRMSENDVIANLKIARERLIQARAQRRRPSRDDKVLTAWNGMMLSALSRGGQVFDAPQYTRAAQTTAEFFRTRMYDERSNTLKRRYRRGHADIDGMLEDYAFFIQGLLDLYETSFDIKSLSWAIRLQEQQDRLFQDPSGGYFSTRADASNILVRMKDAYDGAEPSPNSVAALNLLRLWLFTDRKEWLDSANGIFRALASGLANGDALPQLAAALEFRQSKARHIVIAGEPGVADTLALLRVIHDRFIPNKIVVLADGGAGQERIGGWLPFVKGMTKRNGRATIYICENSTCRLPTSDIATAAQLLDAAPR